MNAMLGVNARKGLSSVLNHKSGKINLMNRSLTLTILILVALLTGCATLSNADQPSVQVVGIESLPSEGLEVRFALKLRVQNPNGAPLAYDGMSVSLDIDGRGLASGVSNATGVIPRFSDEVLTIPVSISAFGIARQLIAQTRKSQNASSAVTQAISYRLRGKLGAPQGSFRSTRFSSSGELDLFASDDEVLPELQPSNN